MNRHPRDASEIYDDGDEHEDPFDQEVIYGPDGEVVYDPWYESQKVDRQCEACGRKFRGMPDHGFCDSCADKRERGEDLYY